MKFARGTPKSVVKAAENAWMHGPKVDKTAPVRPIKPTQPMPTKPGVNPPPSGPRGVGPTDGPSRPMPAPTTPPPPVKPTTMGGRVNPMGDSVRTANGPGLAQNMPAMKRGGKVPSASKRSDGIAQRGKTKGRYI
jgi:hypothetical protein